MKTIHRAAVLGAGVMGAQIAAHLACAGVPVLLLDIASSAPAPGHPRNKLAQEAIERLRKLRPDPIMHAGVPGMITAGNFEDDLTKIAGSDWILEAVVERLDVKQDLWRKVGAIAKPGTILSTNTSGLSCRAVASALPPQHRRNFLGTHFFNPPRYMKLMEIIPTPDTDPGVVSFMREFAEKELGKGTVVCNDTVNFIANRVGVHATMLILRTMAGMGLSVDSVDAITGPAMGRPASATFRTLDVVGIDTFHQALLNTAAVTADPEERAGLTIPEYIPEMVRRGWIGDKTGQGFYKKTKGESGESVILSLNIEAMEYGPKIRPDFPSLEQANRITDPGERLRILTNADDPAGRFAWKVTSRLLSYCAEKAEEMANRDVNAIDRAMRWGYNWETGPFETWNALGVPETVARMEKEGLRVPGWVKGIDGFPIDRSKEQPLAFTQIRSTPSRIVRSDSGSTLMDLGDDVLGFEFHYPRQTIGETYVEMARAAAEEVCRNWRGLVISTGAANFCVGADLGQLLQAAQEKDWKKIDSMVNDFHRTALLLKHLERPVIVAPHGTTIGGGAEIAMQCARTVAAAETYMGFVEPGAGLIPAGGGLKEMAIRAALTQTPGQALDPASLWRRLATAFDAILSGKVSCSAFEARDLGYLRPGDEIVMNQGRLLFNAKQALLDMDRCGYRAPLPELVTVAGPDGRAGLELKAYTLKNGGFASDHDEHIARKIAFVLTGGNLPAGSRVPETYLMDLEREAFLQLAGEQKTQARMLHMLQKGKPLRN